jgi:serine/threonine protein kinase
MALFTGATEEDEITPLSFIDEHFQQIGCLGHGGFGSVFLAKKKSGRRVALKFIRFNELDDDDDEGRDIMERELDAVLKLECEGYNRDLSPVVYFEDWFVGPNYACIVMQYADGGTLAQEILAKQEALDQGRGGQPYAERRIAWYALQLSEALAHAHSRGVAHYDVKSSNILIDRSNGGKLLLADFGSAASPSGEGHAFTEIYGAPELTRAFAEDNFSGLEPCKIDAFGMGCILYEMVCCKKLVDLSGDQTLAKYIEEQGSAEAVFSLACLRLPFLSASPGREQQQTTGYTHGLKSMIKSLLDLQPASRFAPSQLRQPLREDPLSPLLQDYIPAAQRPVPGAPVTIDNIQLGMFVQRASGYDWNDGDADGGEYSVGVVVGLDPDGGYTTVSFPSRTQPLPKPLGSSGSILCRIGANNKFELQVGPTPIKDFHTGSDKDKIGGAIYSTDGSEYELGQLLNPNCMVVGKQANVIFVAPLERMVIPAVPFQLSIDPMPVPRYIPRTPLSIPETWEDGAGQLAPVTDPGERQKVLDEFFSEDGGMELQDYEVVSINRVQSEDMWEAFAAAREQVAAENWGIVNEKRLFFGTGQHSVETLLRTPSDFFRSCLVLNDGNAMFRCSQHAQFGDFFSHRRLDGSQVREVVIFRVALGRTKEEARPPSMCQVTFHSVFKAASQSSPHRLFFLPNPSQAYPEYVISYKPMQPRPGRRIVRVRCPTRAGTVIPRTRTTRGERLAVRSHVFRPEPVPLAPAGGAARPERNFPGTPGVVPPAVSFAGRAGGSRAPAGVARNFPGTPDVVLQGRAGVPLAPAGVAARPELNVPRTTSTPSTTKATTSSPATPGAATKSCVVCLERDVCMILIPCGHACLCEVCSTKQGLTKLKKKCPECRTPFKQAARFYGRLVED